MDASAWDERYRSKELVWGAEPNAFVAEAAEGLEPGRALDLACGEGRNAVWLASRGWQATAVDFSAEGLRSAAQLAEAAEVELELIEADATIWTAPERAFDLVVVAYLQLPREPRRAALRTAVAAVAPGGRLVVVAHDADNLAEGVGGPQDAALLYRADGFELLEAGQRRREVAGADRSAIDTVVIARRLA
jgi:SAM-dependent methyltransferase